MPLTEIFFVSSVFSLEIVIAILLFSSLGARILLKSFFRKTVLFFLVQLQCAALVLLGGYLEDKDKLYTRVRQPIDEYRAGFPESVSIKGDPALVYWLENQRPALPRPDYSDAGAFQKWQKSLRDTLHGVFGISDIGLPIEVAYNIISSTMVDKLVTRIFLTYDSFDGTTIPAYLFLPSTSTSKPAVLVLHGHVGRYFSGVNDTAGLIDSYQHGVALGISTTPDSQP